MTTIIMVSFLAYLSQPTTQVTPPAWELSLPFLFPAEDLGHSGGLILRSGLYPHLPFSQVASVNTGCAHRRVMFDLSHGHEHEPSRWWGHPSI